MSTKPYDPLQHSVVQAMVGTWSRFEADDFIEALLDSILSEIKRVHWNIYQHEWGPTWHSDGVRDPEIDGIEFVRYYDDQCDCGGQYPVHADSCDWSNRHGEWNSQRLSALTDADGTFHIFDEARESAWVQEHPRPDCICGGAAAFDEERGCLPTCIGQKPNFKHEDVEFRWYKRPGRGMSTNKDWSAQEWRDWHDRCLATVRAFEGDHYSDENRNRIDRLRQSFVERHPKENRW